MRKLFLLASSVWLLQTGCVGECGDLPVTTVSSGTYGSLPNENLGSELAGIQHPGPVDWMEVDREAGLVRLHGTSDEGQPFVETWRIAKATRY